MNEDEKRFLKELTDIRIEFNQRVTKLMWLVAVVFVVLIIGQTFVNWSNQRMVAEISTSHDRMIEQLSKDYFTTDYYYPEVTQTTDVKAGD